MRYIYNFLFYLLLPLLPLRLYLRSRKNPAYLKNWGERFAHYSTLSLKNSIWLHAVSLGEAIAAIPLIKQLQDAYPNKNIVITTMTPTGREKIKATFPESVFIFYVPYDYPQAVKRFLEHIEPNLLIIMETELWPNLIYYTAKRHVPILLVNARLSLNSFLGYNRIKSFISKVLNNITVIAAQSKEDGNRFIQLGFPSEKLHITGNIKFDIDISQNILKEAQIVIEQWKLDKTRPIWIAASTHKGEEEKVLKAARKILEKLPNALLILVPRHPERFEEVITLCNQQGFNTIQYSKNETCTAKTQVIIGDVIGKLLMFYNIAQVAFVGGSLVPTGGHNLLEPAALDIPVVTGSSLANFQEISELLFNAGAAVLVRDELQLAKAILKLLIHDKRRAELVAAAKKVVAKNKGALTKIMRLIAEAVKTEHHRYCR